MVPVTGRDRRQGEFDLGLRRPVPDGVWQLQLPWSKPPLNLNDRLNPIVKAKIVAEVRSTVGWLIRQAGIGPQPRVRVQLHYVPRDRRTRDSDNLWATAKPCIDALKDTGVVPDDHDGYVVRRMPRIHPPKPGGRGQLVFVIEALEA